MKKEITTLDSRTVYKNKWMTLREDRILRESGTEGVYSVVEKPDFAIVIPVDGEWVYMVEQFRYPIGKRQLEFPQGAWEENPDAEPQVLAAGELQEETGLVAKQWDYVGYQYLAYGFCDQGYHIFVARELSMTQKSLDPEEEGLLTKTLSLKELETKILAGDINDATTCNAFGLARLKGLL